ncbi:VOC family protein [Pasteurellaceae bacterium TAE3-ERU1]|nr:VOC family protein [Pasteurellaceae bacterium TAE3-ERU1]
MALQLSVHHIAIIASNYAKSKVFYTDVLGARIIHETYRAERDSYKLDLALADGVQIELFSFPAPPARPTQPEACGLRHLAFGVDDIESAVSYLSEHGIACEPIRIDPITSRAYTFFKDPDNLPLELYQK